MACERCDGSGAEPGSRRVTCPTCRGAGQIRRSGDIITFTQTCPTCAGAGTKVEKPCTACRGEGRVAKSTKLNVRIPPGVDTGSRLRSSGNGEAGMAGGNAGDLYIVLSVKEHELFERQGEDLFCEIPIKFTLATLGGPIELPTLFGKGSLKIPPVPKAARRFASAKKVCRVCAAGNKATNSCACRSRCRNHSRPNSGRSWKNSPASAATPPSRRRRAFSRKQKVFLIDPDPAEGCNGS